MAFIEKLGLKLFHQFDPETAHGMALKALQMGVLPQPSLKAYPALAQTLWGVSFPNPIGVAAGFDKNAVAPDAMLKQGFGFIEVGAVTPRPQVGNPKPRLFRLHEDQAVINRFGFNNDGLAAMQTRLRARKPNAKGILGVNLGANKDSVDKAEDYAQSLRSLIGLADFFTVNVSSPNTQGLRGLQSAEALQPLLERVLAARAETGKTPPVLVKIAPDLTDEGLEAIAQIALAVGIDGFIATNTTLDRTGLQSCHAGETGGLSGQPLFLRRLYRLTEGKLPIIGVGGVASGQDAFAKICAGASLVQLYSALVYQGAGLGRQICADLMQILAQEGLTDLNSAIGSKAQTPMMV